MNIDPIEVNKFDEMAAQWWDLNGACKPLHDLNPIRLDFILQRVNLTDKKVLDVGCGGGILTESISKFCDKIVGLDASDAAICVAREHAQQQGLGIDYRVGLLEDVAKDEKAKFDVLTCMELIEHVPDPAELIADCAKALVPGGDLFVSTLNRTPASFLKAVVGAEYLLRMLPKGTHQYAQFVKPSELQSWAENASLFMSSISGLDYNPFTRRTWLKRSVQVNYIAHFKKVEQ